MADMAKHLMQCSLTGKLDKNSSALPHLINFRTSDVQGTLRHSFFSSLACLDPELKVGQSRVEAFSSEETGLIQITCLWNSLQ